MGFFVQLTDAIAERQSLLVTGLDPNPEMLQSWATRHGMGGRSFLSQARHWIKAVIEATAPHVCAYKPSLGFYQALGPVGLELLLEVRDLVPPDLPLIVDAKHGDLNSSSALAHYLFKELGADAVTLSPLAGQDIAAPFLLYPGKAVVMTCHSSNQAARQIQHYPNEETPLYLQIVRETQLWATPDQLLLEVGTSDPAILARVRSEAPERFLILRSLWGEEEKLDAMLQAGLGAAVLLAAPAYVRAQALSRPNIIIARPLTVLNHAAAVDAALRMDAFKAEGLNVTIDQGSGSVEGINRVASGAYEVGFADINSLIKYRLHFNGELQKSQDQL